MGQPYALHAKRNREYAQRYRAQNRERCNAIGRKAYYTKRETILADLSDKYATERAWLNDIKAKPCLDCGVQYPPYVMEFDHVRGKKKCSVGQMCGRQRSRKSILAEIAKCELVCANCHRERTYSRGQYRGNSPKTPDADWRTQKTPMPQPLVAR